MNLANKYRPRTFDDVVEQGTVSTILRKICEEGELSNRNFLLIGPAGTGKAQPLYSKVLTPEGFIEMKDVGIGTLVFTDSGAIAKVSGVYPQGTRPIYEITLQDRTCIRVSDEHLNVVYRYNEDRKEREDFCITTKELIKLFNKSRFKLRIDVPAVDWDSRDLPVDPYLLGALIGNGALQDKNLNFSNSEPDVVRKVNDILVRDWNMELANLPGRNVDYYLRRIHKMPRQYTFYYEGAEIGSTETFAKFLADQGYPMFDSGTLRRLCDKSATNTLKKFPELESKVTVVEDTSWKANDCDLLDTLKELGLLVNSKSKFIPNAYLTSSKEQRLQLLQGLCDTDGYTCIGNAHLETTNKWTTVSTQLSNDFEFLVRSLGIRDTVISAPFVYTNKCGDKVQCSVAYTHHLKVPSGLQYYSSIKHSERYKPRQNEPLRNIVSIEYIGDEECQCIMVDHPDHTYISDGFIPTHNTTLARIMANVLNDNNGTVIEVDAASHGGVDSIRELCEQAHSYPIGQKWKVFILDECHCITPAGWAVFLKTLEDTAGKSIFMFATTNPEKIPDTILSRVQTFQLSKISLEGIVSRVKYVLDKEVEDGESIKYTDDAVNYIAKLANGGMRDALTLTDKVLAYSNEINSETVSEALSLPNYDDYFELLGGYAKHDNQKIASIIDKVYNSGVNFVKWFESFHSFVTNVMKYIFLQDISLTMIPTQYEDKIKKYSTAHASICLKLANKLLTMNNELKSTNYLQEIALTYLCSNPKKAGT